MQTENEVLGVPFQLVSMARRKPNAMPERPAEDAVSGGVGDNGVTRPVRTPLPKRSTKRASNTGRQPKKTFGSLAVILHRLSRITALSLLTKAPDPHPQEHQGRAQ